MSVYSLNIATPPKPQNKGASLFGPPTPNGVYIFLNKHRAPLISYMNESQHRRQVFVIQV